MAKKITIEISDDTDGSPADQTIPFGLDGVSYEVDLSHANAGVLRATVQPYVTVARRTGGRRVKLAVGQSTDDTSKAPQPVADHSTTHDIRSWAQNNGHEVADRGRIARSVVDAYHASHKTSSSRTSLKTRTRSEKEQQSTRSE
ncbi:Lsr2 family protein [Amycolatopsis sp. NPDC023774]|uniref:histone-like nucleoid-structuring protein Lsr2 n=1 Tax=Amycolatopsis sp. NPDC023774 TaxID=3155015 RepID=UPI0033D301E2